MFGSSCSFKHFVIYQLLSACHLNNVKLPSLRDLAHIFLKMMGVYIGFLKVLDTDKNEIGDGGAE